MKNLIAFLLLACATTFAAAQTISTTPPNSVPELPEPSGCPALAVDGAWGNSANDGFPRRAQSIVYDSARDRLVEFGGTDKRNRGRPTSSTDLIFNDEVWVRPASLASGWTRLVTAGTGPTSRGFHSAIYDPVADRMIVYGGVHSIRGLSDLWELDFRS